MSAEVGRRVFVGAKEERIDIDRRRLLGSGAAVVLAAGSLGGLSVAGQGRDRGAGAPVVTPLVREIRAQLREGLQKLRALDPQGPVQLATTIRLYAATVDDSQLSLLRKVNRQRLLSGAHNHAEISRLANELGIDPSQLPATFTNRNREAMLDLLLVEGLAAQMRKGTDVLARMKPSNRVRPVSAQTGSGCQSCEPACNAADAAEDVVAITCAAAVVFPPLMPLCEAASATWLTYYIACAACEFGGWMFDYC
jgi:hypothetical protein